MKNILLIGSGNIATHLALNIDKEKYHIVQVFGRSKENTELLANKINSDWTIDASKIEKADITIIAINDDSIKNILTSLVRKLGWSPCFFSRLDYYIFTSSSFFI